MTSNVGSEYITELGEAEYDEIRSRVMETLRGTFKPEFLNRIDDIIIFHPLSKENMEVIVDIQAGRLQKLLSDRNITITLTEGARKHLAEVGYDPVYGARSLKRLMQREVQDELAMRFLEGALTEGSEVVIDYRDGCLKFDAKQNHPEMDTTPKA